MTNRERALAVLRFQPYDRLPLVHFGFWDETLLKWAQEGHITEEQARSWGDGNPMDRIVGARLGFDMTWQSVMYPNNLLKPAFESKVIREFPGGLKHVLTNIGTVVVQKSDATGIPAEVDHLLKDRASWEEHYKWRLVWSEDRVTGCPVNDSSGVMPWKEGGLAALQRATPTRDFIYGLHCGSLFGHIRDLLGVERACYLLADDEKLFDEIVETVADLCYRSCEYALKAGARFDFAHFWEDICFKNGPLISPRVFRAKIGPQYRRLTELVGRYGLDIVSLDCDGCIDALLPVWLENGVNTMFPIEVGTWNGNLAPWRKQYGRTVKGVGGMNKTVFAHDKAAIDAEIERLKPLVELGGFIPCPDHRLAPDSKWDLVRYYCDRMHKTFG
jgi:uroporphyrinogen decarboxylase